MLGADAAQQVTPERLGEIIAALIVRSSKLDDYAENQLESLRAQIDRIDNYMLEIMGERMDIARKIGEFKRDNGITILQTNRWDEIINDRIKKAAKKELTEDFVKDLMEAVHQESIRHQTRIMNNILAE
jgi:chorismate mutase